VHALALQLLVEPLAGRVRRDEAHAVLGGHGIEKQLLQVHEEPLACGDLDEVPLADITGRRRTTVRQGLEREQLRSHGLELSDPPKRAERTCTLPTRPDR
jgi:hypothetical protein